MSTRVRSDKSEIPENLGVPSQGVLTITVRRIVGPILCIAALLSSPDARHRASTRMQGLTEGKSALICSKSAAHEAKPTDVVNLLSQAECQHALTTVLVLVYRLRDRLINGKRRECG